MGTIKGVRQRIGWGRARRDNALEELAAADEHFRIAAEMADELAEGSTTDCETTMCTVYLDDVAQGSPYATEAEAEAAAQTVSQANPSSLVYYQCECGPKVVIQSAEAAGEPDDTGSGNPDPPAVIPLFSRNFDGYADTAAVNADEWVEVLNSDAQFLDATTAPTGYSKSLRYDWEARADGCFSKSIGRGVRFGSNLYEAWAEIHLRYSANFTTHNPACPPNDHKVLFFQVNDGNYRYQVKIGFGSGSSKQYVLDVAGSETASLAGQGIDPSFSGVNAELWDGAWHVIRWHVKSPSASGVSDGEMDFWVDGTLKKSFTFFTNNLVNASARIPMKALLIGRNKDDAPDNTAMSMYVGPFSVWSEDPGW